MTDEVRNICERLRAGTELAELCVVATPGQQRDLLLKAYYVVFGHSTIERDHEWRLREASFSRKIVADAYESAALMLVPDRSWVRMDEWPFEYCHGPVASVQPIREPPVSSHVATGSTLALALTAAALRAIAQVNAEGDTK